MCTRHHTHCSVESVVERGAVGPSLSSVRGRGRRCRNLNNAHGCPIIPRSRTNAVVPLVVNVSGVSGNARVDSLVAEVEKFHVKLDAVKVDIAKISEIMQEVGEDEPLALVPVVPMMDVLSVLIMREHNETRIRISREHKETLNHVTHWAMVIMCFIAVMYTVHMFHAPVCSMTSPVPPVCAPIKECATAEPSKWDTYMSCARIVAAWQEY